MWPALAKQGTSRRHIQLLSGLSTDQQCKVNDQPPRSIGLLSIRQGHATVRCTCTKM